MNLDTVMSQIEEQLRTIDGLHVVVDGERVNVPCAFVALPANYTFDATYGRGSDTMTIPVVVLVSSTPPRNIRKTLGAYCDGSGDKSVKACIEAGLKTGRYTAFSDVHVTGIDFDEWQNGDVSYPAAIFSLDIYGSGSA